MKLIIFLFTLMTLSANAQQSSTLNWDDARINGKMELTILKRDFEKAVKGIGTIITPNPEEICDNNEELDIKFYYFKGITYELDNGVLNFRHLLLDKKNGFYFTYKNVRLDWNTTTEDLFRIIDVNHTTSSENERKNEGTYLIISLDNKTDEGEWQFHFKEGKLTSIHCVFDC